MKCKKCEYEAKTLVDGWCRLCHRKEFIKEWNDPTLLDLPAYIENPFASGSVDDAEEA